MKYKIILKDYDLGWVDDDDYMEYESEEEAEEAAQELGPKFDRNYNALWDIVAVGS